MSLEDVMAKLSEVLSKEELAEIQGLSKAPESNDQMEALTRKEKEANAKAARILEEKKKIKAENETLLERLEKLESTGLSDIEKMQKDLEKANKATAKYEAELKSVQESHAKSIRSQTLGVIQSKVNFLDIVPEDMRKMSLESAFTGVEDLSDENAVNDTLRNYMEKHKSIIAAESNKSAGTQNIISAQGTPASKAVEDMTIDERAAQLLSGKTKNPMLSRL